MIDWSKSKYFKKNENWGESTKMSPILIDMLNEFREFVDKPIIIHCGYSTDGHSTNSYHYRGLAVDLHIQNIHYIEQLVLAMQYKKFNGIGVYPYWNSPGLHLDIRDTSSIIWYQDNKKRYHYIKGVK